MELFWKASAAVLISIILIPALHKQGQDIAALLMIAVCCMTGTCLLQLLDPVMDFLHDLQALTNVDDSILKILFKLIGISLTCEIATTVCADAGCSSLGKSLQLMGSAAILYLSIPVLQMFLALVQDILGGL